MHTYVMIDEFRVDVLVRRDLTAHDLAAIRRVLSRRTFLPKFRQALRPMFAAHPALAAVRLRIGR